MMKNIIYCVLLIITLFSKENKNNQFEADLNFFHRKIKPIIDEKCLYCHGPKKQKADFRIDKIDPNIIKGNDDERWHEILDLVILEDMPPEDEADEFLTDEELKNFEKWVRQELNKRKKLSKGNTKSVLRRLTKFQYTNTIKDLLNIDFNAGALFPPEGISYEGFKNNGEVLSISPLLFQYYIKSARAALAKAIVITEKPPKTYRYRWTFEPNNKKIHIKTKLGYQSYPIQNSFLNLEYFNPTGLIKNQTFKSELNLYEINFSDMRGSRKNRFWIDNKGINILPIIPHKEVAANIWQGPSPNLKVLMRDFPKEGNFRIRINAKPMENSVGDINKSLLLIIQNSQLNKSFLKYDKKTKKVSFPIQTIVKDLSFSKQKVQEKLNIFLTQSGIYKIDFVMAQGKKPDLRIDYRGYSIQVKPDEKIIVLVKMDKGKNILDLIGDNIKYIGLTLLNKNDELMKYVQLDKRKFKNKDMTYLRAFIGNRTDDGMQYKSINEVIPVDKGNNYYQYTFKGRLENFPLPLMKKNTKEDIKKDSLSGFMIVGVWNDLMAKSKKDRSSGISVKSIEFEAPYFEEWPPKSHKQIFIESKNKENEVLYAQEILKSFITKAYRRPFKIDELNKFLHFWRENRSKYKTFEESIKESLVGILCSPSFLYLSEPKFDKDGKIKKQITEYELASRLSYFLWNSMPDKKLLKLASKKELRKNLLAQVQRMLKNKKLENFTNLFSEQWLDIHFLDTVAISAKDYPKYTRFIKEDFKKETQAFVNYVIVNNLSMLNFFDSDFMLLNQNLAKFYDIKADEIKGSHFRPVSILKKDKRGGLLTQGSFLTGHSTGDDSHPIKRGVWLAKKLLDAPPPKPPANVPEIKREDPNIIRMSVKEQLADHRNKDSCKGCHKGIDPWGIIFENYGAIGEWRTQIKRKLPSKRNELGKYKAGKSFTIPVDSETITPDGYKINGLVEAKKYLLKNQKKALLNSLTKYMLAYALGRSLSYKDEDYIKKIIYKVEKDDYKLYTLIKSIVVSDLFKTR